MLKRILLTCLGFAAAISAANSQSWYQHGQQAVEILTNRDGLYAVTPGSTSSVSTLIGASISGLKIYRDGQEVAAKVVDVDTSGTWSVGDTLWFFGQANHGENERNYLQYASYGNPYSPFYGVSGRYYLLSSAGNGLRMAQSQPAPATAPTLTEWNAELVLAPRDEYSLGNGSLDPSKFHQSFIGQGEGWSSPARNTAVSFTISNPYAVRAGQAKVTAWINGRNTNMHGATLSLGTSQLYTSAFDNYARRIDSAYIATTGIGASISLNLAPATPSDYISLMLAKVMLPVQAAVSDQPVVLNGTLPGQAYIKLPASLPRGFYLQVSDPAYPKVLVYNGTEYEVETSATNVGQAAVWLQSRPYLVSDSVSTAKTLLQPEAPLPGGLLIISSPRLLDTARIYADYRASVAGGGHAVRVVSTEAIYAAYGNGYPTSDAIRQYLAAAVRAGNRPSAVFLIGKGVQHNSFAKDADLAYSQVPTWGVPGSDNFLVSSDTGLFYNKIPIGRLSAKTGRDIINYLNKVKAQEGNTDFLWRKNAYHLSGGRTLDEIADFKMYIQAYSDYVRAPAFGGNAFEYSKQSSSIIEAVDIRDRLNRGVSILTLFGHSASTTTDIDIGNADDPAQGYDNMGRCPLIVVNGCFAGNVFERNVRSLNENWVLAANKGAIAFSGSMDEGLPGFLNRHTDTLYHIQFTNAATIGLPLGQVYQRANKAYMEGGNSVIDSILVSQMVLHGDPMLHLFPFSKPDLTFDGAASRLVDQDVSAFNKSFDLRLRLLNQGLYHPGDSVSLIARISTGGTAIYGQPLKLPALRADTIVDYRISGGFELDNASTIECTVDYLNRIDEQSEENNAVSFSLGRFENGISFVTPTKDAIVPGRSLRLTYRCVTPDPAGQVEIDVDTNRLFRSPSRTIAQGGVTPLTQIVVTLPAVLDSTVFYLRYRLNNAGGMGAWKSFAFTYIESREGWSQSTGFQYFPNDIEGYVIDSAHARHPWSFVQRTATVRLRTVGAGLVSTPANTGIDINGIPFYYGTQSSCFGGNRLMTLRLNKNTLAPYVDKYQQPFDEFWRYSCGRVPTAINFYNSPDLLLASGALSGFNVAQMGLGDYYFAMSQGYLDHPQLGAFLGGASTFIGAAPDSIRLATPGSPMILAGIRAMGSVPGTGLTMLANKFDTVNDTRESLDTTFVIRRYPSEGKVVSAFIGPALSFQQATIGTLRVSGLRDSARFTIRAYRTFTDSGDIIYAGIPQGMSLASIASSYRFVKLFYESPTLQDSTTYLDFWRVTYRPFPEGVALSAISTPEIDAGDVIAVKAKYHHTIGNVGDSLLTRLYVRNTAGALIDSLSAVALKAANTDTSYVSYIWRSSLLSPDTVAFEVHFNVLEKPERSYLNNSVFTQTKLRKDTGMYAGYFEIDGLVPEARMRVSSSPSITYHLNRLFGDRSITMLFGPDCDTCRVSQVVDFSVKGRVAQFNPTDLAPGQYQVQATVQDRFRQLVPLQTARFEVLPKDTLTLFRAFPNPASGSITFTYQCAAANSGGQMELIIYNSFGNTVYTGSAQHAGLVAGNLKWDMRQSGDPIEPGVYLAQLRITANQPNGSASHVLSGTTRVVVVQ